MAVWVLCFFFSLKDVRKTDLWNWVFESQLCLEFISAIPSQDLSWGQLSLTAFWIGGASQHLEKEMVTHSSIPAWRIPWTEEPGGLQSMGSQELGMTERLTHRHLAPGPTHFFITWAGRIQLWCGYSGLESSGRAQIFSIILFVCLLFGSKAGPAQPCPQTQSTDSLALRSL